MVRAVAPAVTCCAASPLTVVPVVVGMDLADAAETKNSADADAGTTSTVNLPGSEKIAVYAGAPVVASKPFTPVPENVRAWKLDPDPVSATTATAPAINVR